MQRMNYDTLYPSWRWYGPGDPISLTEVAATGAAGVVTALHQIPNGAVWPREAIQRRLAELASVGLPWSVVESVPVHEEIKTNGPDCATLLDNYRRTLQHLAASGVTTVCYNFMPVLDWTRTSLRRPVVGGTTLELRAVELAAFDLFHLARTGAQEEYSTELRAAADAHYAGLDAAGREALAETILLGLPGSEEHYDLERFRAALSTYDRIPSKVFRDNLRRFLEAVVPTASREGIKLAIHPDDPPYSVVGLPRIVSTAADLRELLSYVDEPVHGLCLCTGSLGVREENKLPALAEEFADRIHFLHFRNVVRTEYGGFYESGHLTGDVDMAAVMQPLLAAGRAIPYRPDHGFTILADQDRLTNPGYSLYGRMRGLAELEGLRHGLGAQPKGAKGE